MSTPHTSTFLAGLRPALVLFLLLTVITGLIYPLLITGVAQLLFPGRAAGSLLMRDGRIIADDTPDHIREQTHTRDIEGAFLALVEGQGADREGGGSR